MVYRISSAYALDIAVQALKAATRAADAVVKVHIDQWFKDCAVLARECDSPESYDRTVCNPERELALLQQELQDIRYAYLGYDARDTPTDMFSRMLSNWNHRHADDGNGFPWPVQVRAIEDALYGTIYVIVSRKP